MIMSDDLPTSSPAAEPTPMLLAELSATAGAMFGPKWGKPLARAIGRSPRAVRFWKTGDRPVPPAAAEKIRELANIGPVGMIVRAAVRKVIADVAPWAAHLVAQQAVADLARAGLLDKEGSAVTAYLKGSAADGGTRPRRRRRPWIGIDP